MSTILNAANVIVSLIATATADTATGGAASAVTGALSLNEMLRRLVSKTPALPARIAAQITTELAAHHLTDPQKTLIPQMITANPLTPAEVMAATRNPHKIAAAMLAKLTDPAHKTAAVQDAFARVLTPILTTLLADTAVTAALAPAFQTAVAESLASINDQLAILTCQMADAIKGRTIAEFVVTELARRFVPGAGGDFDGARRDLENALEIYFAQQAQNALPSNHTDAIDAVMAEVARLNADAKFDAASDALTAALAAEQTEDHARAAASNARQANLLDQGIAQDRLRNNPTSAAQRLVARLALDAPGDMFAALRVLRDEWYAIGRDKGLQFELLVAIALAEITLTHAKTTDHRGAALNYLGIAFATLGEREIGSKMLEQAVISFQNALLEYPRKHVPLDWAGTQMNLGGALVTLGEREAGIERLSQAVTAFQFALLERTRRSAPLDWAMTQMNLGIALLNLGEREGGTERLKQAVESFENALLEQNRQRSPLDWAMTQNNLGNALVTLGQREANTGRLERAMSCFQNALLEHAMEHVPMDWAMIQNNLGNVLISFGKLKAGAQKLELAEASLQKALLVCSKDIAPIQWAMTQLNLCHLSRVHFDKTNDAKHLDTAKSHAAAAREVFAAAKATHYLAMAEDQLAEIKSRRP